MLPNGLLVTSEMALGAQASHDHTAFAFVLGLFREDVLVLRPLGIAVPNPSFGHIWPRSRARIEKLYALAVKAARRGERLQGAFHLGRAMHVLIDMACPAHAQAVPHYLRDPFERYVEAHAHSLASLPVPELSLTGPPAALVDSLAGAARLYPVSKRSDSIPAQARHLVPLAAAHVRALVAAYLAEQGQPHLR